MLFALQHSSACVCSEHYSACICFPCAGLSAVTMPDNPFVNSQLSHAKLGQLTAARPPRPSHLIASILIN